jgi:hypothetical protein
VNVTSLNCIGNANTTVTPVQPAGSCNIGHDTAWRIRRRSTKKKQIDINRIREGIGRGRQPAGQVESEHQVEGEQWSKGEKAWGAGEEPQHHHNMKSEQDDVRNVE